MGLLSIVIRSFLIPENMQWSLCNGPDNALQALSGTKYVYLEFATVDNHIHIGFYVELTLCSAPSSILHPG